jgi:hypothetical protein
MRTGYEQQRPLYGGGQTLFALFRVAEALEEEAIDSYFAGT